MNKSVHIRVADYDDIPYIASNLRAADKAEMRAVLGSDVHPEDALSYGMEVSLVPYVGMINDKPSCIFGAVPEPTHAHVGAVWLAGTNDIISNKRAFISHSKDYLSTVFDPFTLLWNCVDKRNSLHIRWLRWLGFSFLREVPKYGEEGKPFYEFAKIKNV
jgi:hypothetical protein